MPWLNKIVRIPSPVQWTPAPAEEDNSPAAVEGHRRTSPLSQMHHASAFTNFLVEPSTSDVADRLQNPNPSVRIAALEVLCHLDPKLVAQHQGAIVQHLQKVNSCRENELQPSLTVSAPRLPRPVTKPDYGYPWLESLSVPVVEAMNKLELAVWAQRTAVQLEHCGSDMYSHEQFRAVESMNWSRLASHSLVVAQRRGTTQWNECCATLVALARLEPPCLLLHGDAIAQCLLNKSVLIRWTAVVILSTLDSAVLSNHVGALAQLLGDSDLNVRQITMMAFNRLDLKALIQTETGGSVDIDRFVIGSHGLLSDFNAVNRSIVFPQGNSLLHAVAHVGLAQLTWFLVAGSRGASLDARNFNKETPLHVAAQAGHLQVCQILVKAGALVKAKNDSQVTPEDLARQGGHHPVVDCLYSASNNIRFVRSGAGEAFIPAMKDQRPIVKVAWHVIQTDGIFGIVGGKHSFLLVTVASLQEGAHTYIMEKAALPVGKAQASKTFANGVYVSHWQDALAGALEEPIHVLNAKEIKHSHAKGTLSMRILRGIAVDIGPYHVARCNCHHMALAVYNACGKDGATVDEMPNADLTRMAELLTGMGIHVGDSIVSAPVSTPSQSVMSQSVLSQSVHCGGSQSLIYELATDECNIDRLVEIDKSL